MWSEVPETEVERGAPWRSPEPWRGASARCSRWWHWRPSSPTRSSRGSISPRTSWPSWRRRSSSAACCSPSWCAGAPSGLPAPGGRASLPGGAAGRAGSPARCRPRPRRRARDRAHREPAARRPGAARGGRGTGDARSSATGTATARSLTYSARADRTCRTPSRSPACPTPVKSDLHREGSDILPRGADGHRQAAGCRRRPSHCGTASSWRPCRSGGSGRSASRLRARAPRSGRWSWRPGVSTAACDGWSAPRSSRGTRALWDGRSVVPGDWSSV